MSTEPDASCLFCKIAAGEVPAEVVYSDERTVAFRDVNPQAPTHVLVIPRRHERNAADLAEADPDSLVAVFDTARHVAAEERLSEGYRMVFNTGAAAGQTVFHAHLHVLGGRELGWPPG